MAKSGKITLYSGTGKTSGKEFTALRLEVGEWTALYFPDSKFEMDYIKKYLSQPEPTPQDAAADDFFGSEFEDIQR